MFHDSTNINSMLRIAYCLSTLIFWRVKLTLPEGDAKVRNCQFHIFLEKSTTHFLEPFKVLWFSVFINFTTYITFTILLYKNFLKDSIIRATGQCGRNTC